MKVEKKTTTTYTLDGTERALCCPKCGFLLPFADDPFSDMKFTFDFRPRIGRRDEDEPRPEMLITSDGRQLCPRCVADYLAVAGVPVLTPIPPAEGEGRDK